MEFCSGCGTRLILRPGKSGSEPWLLCSRCGYKRRFTKTSLAKPRKKGSRSLSDTVAVVDGKEELVSKLTVRFNCLKCGNDWAYQWYAQARWSDESKTQFFRCTRCGYTERG